MTPNPRKQIADPAWSGMDGTNYWFDSLPARRREHYVDGKLAEWIPADCVDKLHPRAAEFAVLPPYMTAAFGTYLRVPPLEPLGEYPPMPDCSGLPLTVTVNKVTVNSSAIPAAHPQPPTTGANEVSQLQLNPLPAELGGQPAPAAPHPVVAAVQHLINTGAAFDVLTKTYLSIDDKKKDLDAQLKVKTGPLTEALTLIENHLLAKFTEMGVDNVKTDAGTPYITTRTSASVADGDAYWRFVLGKALSGLPLNDAQRGAITDSMLASGALAFLENRAAKGPVEQYVQQTQALPPGINWNASRAVNVRRPGK